MSKREGKTEVPTEKKKKDSRKKGTVSKSQDLGPWITLLVSTYLFPVLIGSVGAAAVEPLSKLKQVADQPDALQVADLLGDSLMAGLLAVMPFMAMCMLVGVVAHVTQTGLVLSLHPLKPDFKRINPLEGAKRLLSPRSLWDTAKQVAKAGVIAWLCWPPINNIVEELTKDGRVSLMGGVAASTRSLIAMTRTTCYAIIAIALMDFVYQRRNKLMDLKMTKQEVRDEMKNSEGDPQIKQRIRALQMAMSRNRMMSDIPNATVVVTNPTHVAVALRYDPLAGGAPTVIASGVGSVAAKIRERARDAGVPIVEAKPLARALWRACEVGDEIPAQLYEAVAKVLAFVRRLRGGILSASVLPLPRQYHVDDELLEAITGRRRKRLPV